MEGVTLDRWINGSCWVDGQRLGVYFDSNWPRDNGITILIIKVNTSKLKLIKNIASNLI
jgi:hypothetical protein